MASRRDERGVDVMLPLVVRVARLRLKHAWPVPIGRSHDDDGDDDDEKTRESTTSSV